MRLMLVLPDTPEINEALDRCRKKHKKLPWINVTDLDQSDRAAALAARLLQDDCKKGYIVEGFPRDLAESEALTAALRAENKKTPLPLALHWNGKPAKDQREAIKAWRDEHQPLLQALHEKRRLIAVSKVKKLHKGFAEARIRSRPVQLLRRGTSGVFVAVLVLIAIGILFFRDPFLKQLLINTVQSRMQARFDIGGFETTLSDAGLHMEHVAAADADQPMQNVFEFEQASTSWDVEQLLAFNLHAREMTVSGLAFGTEREESGALAGVPAPADGTPEEAPAEEADKDNKFLNAMMNTLAEFKPPAPEDLESTKVYNEITADAEQRRAAIEQRSSALNVEDRVAASQAAANNLKQVSLPQQDTSAVQRQLETNNKKLAELRAASAGDMAELKQTLDAMKDFKVEDPKEDLEQARQLIEKARAVKESVDAVKGRIAESKTVVAKSRELVKQAGEDIKENAAQARQQMQENLKAVRSPLEQAQADIDAVISETKAAAAAVRDNRERLQEAIAKDVSSVKKQYSVSGVQQGAQQLVEELVGKTVMNTLQQGLSYYHTVKPYLPVSKKKKKKVKRKGVEGTTYSFPLVDAAEAVARLWIKQAHLHGVFPVTGDDITFQASLLDFSSDMAATGKPVVLNMDGASADKAKQVQAGLRYGDDELITGSLSVHGLSMQRDSIAVGGNMAGVAPQGIHGEQISVSINELALGEDQFDALVDIEIKKLKLAAPSGEGVHPEIAGVFTETYANLDNITLKIGLGARKAFRTEPDIGQLIARGMRRRVQARMDDARSRAEAAVQANGQSRLGDLSKLAESFKQPGGLAEQQNALKQANADVAKLEEQQTQSLNGEEQAAQDGLGGLNDSLGKQEQDLQAQQEELDTFRDNIAAEQKRIQKELLGDSIKDKLKLPKF